MPGEHFRRRIVYGNMAGSSASKRWREIAIALGAIGGVLVLAIICGGVLFWSRHVHTELIAPDRATSEFERARAQFAGQQPLIEFRGFDEPPIVRRDVTAPRRELAALNILAFDPATKKLRRVDVPAWTLRLMSVNGKIRLTNLERDDRDRITLDDLERHGPGLVLDASLKRDSQGSRLLIWTE